MVKLDDLGGLEPGRGQLGEAHHEHRAHREVGGDDAVALGEPRLELGVVVVVEPGGADDRVDAVVRAPPQVGAGRVEVGEVDRDLGAGLGQRIGIGRHDQPGHVDADRFPQVGSGLLGVDRRHQLELGIGGHGLAHGCAHAARRPEDTDSHGTLGTGAA